MRSSVSHLQSIALIGRRHRFWSSQSSLVLAINSSACFVASAMASFCRASALTNNFRGSPHSIVDSTLSWITRPTADRATWIVQTWSNGERSFGRLLLVHRRSFAYRGHRRSGRFRWCLGRLRRWLVASQHRWRHRRFSEWPAEVAATGRPSNNPICDTHRSM